ncbi:ferredoxin reductase [Parvularcula bermudensis HTCC2503]|uniref:Ferredoxin reductase n=1 Tax=Parvularcula bermudensis (strain ATCC BAA-594 / HTCC2503 / KCTC 12087) TaxID=314260 RepID=E0TCV8_PARBH|nr:FAD-dependent oxidoreductase [Parvularcula bermudensis]ADM10341.1 ferredoxin reductase [Parvularcula bermudensis HTCC2503]
MTGQQHIVVIGAGQAAAQFISAYRQRGGESKITLVGDELDLPYQRPPLSKAYLKGEFDADRLSFKPQSFYDDSMAVCLLGEPAASINREQKVVTMTSGKTLPYDVLVLATGSRPRPLPSLPTSYDNVFSLRTRAESNELGAALSTAKHLTVIGGGFIGLEVAAISRSRDIPVTLLERADRLLARVTSPLVSDFFTRLHRRHGVNVHLSAEISEVRTDGNRVTHLALGDGQVIDTDIILVGIGGIANDELAKGAGVNCQDGIVVDDLGATNDPAIFAAGDCTRRPVPSGDLLRIESVYNAKEQADQIACHLTGSPSPVVDTPWFWSDQYDVKLQTAGLFNGYDEALPRGETDDAPFSVLYFKDERLIAADCLNDGPMFMTAKQILKTGAVIPKADLIDPAVPLKEIMAKAKAAG